MGLSMIRAAQREKARIEGGEASPSKFIERGRILQSDPEGVYHTHALLGTVSN